MVTHGLPSCKARIKDKKKKKDKEKKKKKHKKDKKDKKALFFPWRPAFRWGELS